MYQDNRSIPLTSLLEKALGDSTTALLGERAAPDLLRLTPRTVSGAEMLQAVCTAGGHCPGKCAGAGGQYAMLELVRAASRSAAAADAPAELRLAAKQVTLTDAAGGAAVEVLYRMVRDAENWRKNLCKFPCNFPARDFLFGRISGRMRETHLCTALGGRSFL